MTIDLTNRFTSLRLQSQRNNEYQRLLYDYTPPTQPTWKTLYMSIRGTADDISFYLKKLEQRRKQVLSTDYQFEAALQREIYFARDEVLGKLRQFYAQIKQLENERETSHEARIVVPAAINCLKQIQADNAAHFRRLQVQLAQSNYRREIDYENDAQLPEEARLYYYQARETIYGYTEEIRMVVRQIDEIVDIIQHMAGKVYESGTVIDRIDYHVVDARDLVDAGVQNLEKARKDQKKVGCLRSFTYGLYLTNVIMCIAYCILKA